MTVSDFLGKNCPYCKTKFTEEDNIVLCSACDMPHHRDCWVENQGCTTFGCMGTIKGLDGSVSSVTASEFVFEQPQTQFSGRFCTSCGASLTAGAAFCTTCGSPVAQAAPQPAPAPAAYTQPQPTYTAPQPQPTYTAPQPQPTYTAPQPQPTYTAPQPQPTYTAPQPQPTYTAPQPQQPYTQGYSAPQQPYSVPQPQQPYGNPYGQGYANPQQQPYSNPYGQQGGQYNGGYAPNTVLEQELHQLVGPKAEYYIPQFRQIKSNNKIVSWNWPAFLITPFWLIYRRMYGYGFAFLGVMFLVSLIGNTFLTLLAAGGYVAAGLFANFIYLKRLENIAEHARTMGEPFRTQHLGANSGVNTAAAVWTAVGYFVLSLIINLV